MTTPFILQLPDWTGNVFDFYFRVYNKLKQTLNVPFKLSGVTRIDDTPMHEALREAFANCLINADYFGSRGIIVTLQLKQITFANPGYSRTGKILLSKKIFILIAPFFLYRLKRNKR